MKNKGFTLIEVIIITAIIAALIAVVVIPLVRFRKEQALQNTTNAIVSILNEARTKTLASYNNTFYSIHFESTNMTLFVGGTYNISTPTNEVYNYESPITVTYSLQGGGSNISFDKLKGTTSQYGTITASIPGGSSRTITVSSTGTIVRN